MFKLIPGFMGGELETFNLTVLPDSPTRTVELYVDDVNDPDGTAAKLILTVPAATAIELGRALVKAGQRVDGNANRPQTWWPGVV